MAISNFLGFHPSSPIITHRIHTRKNQFGLHACMRKGFHHNNSNLSSSKPVSRRAFLCTLTAVIASSIVPQRRQSDASEETLNIDETVKPTEPNRTSVKVVPSEESLPAPEQPTVLLGHRTPSGIYYVDFQEGNGRTPNWGDLVNIDYILYTVKEKSDLIEHESSFKEEDSGFLIHHGNGEQILGLEEMVHSMRTGSKRRCIIPAPLGYIRSGMLPIPYSQRKRSRFLDALNKGNGTVVLDLQVNWISEDPDDRGYYSDLVLSDEEIIDVMKKNRVETVPPDALSITI